MSKFVEMSARDKSLWRQYRIELGIGLAVYAVLLVGVLVLVDEDSAAAPFLILLPMIGVVFIVRAVYRWIAGADEFGQRIQLTSMTVGFGVAMVVALAFGFVGLADVGHPALGPWRIFSSGMAAWGLAAGVAYSKADV